jgi:nitrate/nitrite transport system permease protein
MEINLWASLWETWLYWLIGFIPAVIVGTLLGIASGWNPLLAKIAQIIIQLPASVPIVLLFPLLGIILSPIGSTSSGILNATTLGTFLSAVWIIAIQTSIGFCKICENNWQWSKGITRITLGWRIALAQSWCLLILMGMYLGTGQPNVGFYIWDAYNQGSNDSPGKLLIATLAITVSIFLVDQLIQLSGDYLRDRLRKKETIP